MLNNFHFLRKSSNNIHIWELMVSQSLRISVQGSDHTGMWWKWIIDATHAGLWDFIWKVMTMWSLKMCFQGHWVLEWLIQGTLQTNIIQQTLQISPQVSDIWEDMTDRSWDHWWAETLFSLLAQDVLGTPFMCFKLEQQVKGHRSLTCSLKTKESKRVKI